MLHYTIVCQQTKSLGIQNVLKSGKTQNANESVQSLIRRYCPKECFVSRKRVELAALYAVSHFNMGCVASLRVKESDSTTIPCLAIAQRRDARRLKQSTYRDTLPYKKLKENGKKKMRKMKGGVTYAAGSFF